MTRVRLLLAVLALTPLAGCDSLKQWIAERTQRPTGELKPVDPQQLVSYVNGHASRMQTLSAEVQVTAGKSGTPLQATLNGNLAASQPRNFRMKAERTGLANVLVDLGSNKDQFWVYFDGMGADKLYVFASHTDFETGKAKLPPGVTFEPDWVMQALGMLPLPEGNQYTAPPPDKTNRTYSLRWRAVVPDGTFTPEGKPKGRDVIKEIVFDGDPTVSGDPKSQNIKPQVKKHIIRDMQGKIICSAEVKSVETVLPANRDPHQAVQYPTRVVLKWEEQGFEMALSLSKGRLNEPISPTDAADRFSLPKVSGITPIDLAEYRFRMK